MEFLRAAQKSEPSLNFAQLAALAQKEFDVQVHPRSIERQLLRKKTLLRSAAVPDTSPLSHQVFVAGYEELRRQVLIRQRGPGVAILMRRGVQAWMSVCLMGSVPLPPRAFTPTEAVPVIPQGLHTEIVLILAGMLLHRCQEVRA